MASQLSRKDPDIRAFEHALQRCTTVEKQREKMSERPEDFLAEVAETVVKIMDFKRKHSSYVLPRSYSMRMCTHLLDGHCTYDSSFSNAPCLNPHRYALNRAAIHIQHMANPLLKRRPCKSADACTFKDRCKFLHTEDILINELVDQIYQERIAAKAESWKTVGKGARSITVQPAKEAVSRDGNRYACLEQEDGNIDTTESDPEVNDSSSEQEIDDSSPEEEYEVKERSSSPAGNANHATFEVLKEEQLEMSVPPLMESPVAASEDEDFSVVESVYNSVFDQNEYDDPFAQPYRFTNRRIFVNMSLTITQAAETELCRIQCESAAYMERLRARAAAEQSLEHVPQPLVAELPELVRFQLDSDEDDGVALEAPVRQPVLGQPRELVPFFDPSDEDTFESLQ